VLDVPLSDDPPGTLALSNIRLHGPGKFTSNPAGAARHQRRLYVREQHHDARTSDSGH
jgi:hypothetical protein